MKSNVPALLVSFLLQIPIAQAEYSATRIKATRDYQICQIKRQEERDLSRNMSSLIAYSAIPDFILEQMEPKPAFYNMAKGMISLREETRQFLAELGLDANDPLMTKPMISKGDIYEASSKLMKNLEKAVVPTEDGFELHSDVYTSPVISMDRVENAHAKLLEALGSMDQDLKRWTSWGGGESEDCSEELKTLQSTPPAE